MAIFDDPDLDGFHGTDARAQLQVRLRQAQAALYDDLMNQNAAASLSISDEAKAELDGRVNGWRVQIKQIREELGAFEQEVPDHAGHSEVSRPPR